MGEKHEDEYGQYQSDAGSPHPVDPDTYDACNAVLKYTWSRYGERRYCTGLAVSNFTKHGVETDYEHDDFCKHHQSRAELMKQHEDSLKTGAHAKSHEHLFQHMEPHKQLLANDLYRSLVEESTYDFDMEVVELEADASDSEFGGGAVDTIILDHPVPNDHEMRATALWFAALDFMTMESIKAEQFRVSAEETYEGRDLAVGERVKTITVTDNGEEIEDTDEHHLNLSLSRIQKDYDRHLEFGGVEDVSDDDSVSEREWVIDVVGSEPAPQPETTSGDSSPLHTNVNESDLTDLEADADDSQTDG